MRPTFFIVYFHSLLPFHERNLLQLQMLISTSLIGCRAQCQHKQPKGEEPSQAACTGA